MPLYVIPNLSLPGIHTWINFLTYRVSNLKSSTENWKLILITTTVKFWFRKNEFQIQLLYLVNFSYWTPCKLPSLSSQTHNFHRAIVLLILAFGLLALDLGSSENHLEKGHKGQNTSVTNLFACIRVTQAVTAILGNLAKYSSYLVLRTRSFNFPCILTLKVSFQSRDSSAINFERYFSRNFTKSID